jgi:hypothetical protein
MTTSNETDNQTTELQGILDEFEHECLMLRVEASETRAKDDVVRKSYERIRDGFVGRIAATLGGGECEIVEHYAASTRGEIGRERVKLSCGHIVERHSKFCQECGAKIRKAVRYDNY